MWQFNNDLIKQGRAGGEEAAKRLYKQVHESTGLKPIIRVFASIGRLAGVFAAGGLIASPGTFREFTLGFNDPSHEHIDFIDVGEGKEKADWKLNSELRPPARAPAPT